LPGHGTRISEFPQQTLVRRRPWPVRSDTSASVPAINTKGEPAALARAFIDFIHGKEGTKILAAQGCVPLK